MNPELFTLIDRLQEISEKKYPNRKWSNDFYYECAFQWKGKIQELRERILKLGHELPPQPEHK